MLDNVRVNDISAYLYLRLGEQMPEDAPDEWFIGADPNLPKEHDVLVFINLTGLLLRRLGETDDYMAECYDVAKLFSTAVYGNEKTGIRHYFRWLYTMVFGYENGPRWGEFISIYGVDEFSDLVVRRFNSPL